MIIKRKGDNQVRSNRSRLALLGVLALALSVAVGPGVAQAKKLKPFEETATVNVPIPNVPAAGPSTPVVSLLEVPKKYRQRKIGDLNVTGIQTAGSANGASDDLVATLTAPSGRTVLLFKNVGPGAVANGANFGPWTLDDDSPFAACASPLGLAARPVPCCRRLRARRTCSRTWPPTGRLAR